MESNQNIHNPHNGRIKLSGYQLMYGISVLVTIILTYSDLKNRVANLSDKMSQVYSKEQTDKMNLILENQNKILEAEIQVINGVLKIRRVR